MRHGVGLLKTQTLDASRILPVNMEKAKGPKLTNSTQKSNSCDHLGSVLQDLDETQWLLASGGTKSEKCGELLSGNSLHMSYPGQRIISTVDLDLSKAKYDNLYDNSWLFKLPVRPKISFYQHLNSVMTGRNGISFHLQN